jgi:DNA-binding CsgD family transcriptional regulator
MEQEPKVTKRQIEVLEKIAEGESYKTGGRKLNIKDGTVRSHLREAKQRLESLDTFQAIVKASRMGLLDLRSKLEWDRLDTLDLLSPAEFEVLQASIGEEGDLKSAKYVSEKLIKNSFTVKVLRERIRGKTGLTIAGACLLLVAASAAGYQYRKNNGT